MNAARCWLQWSVLHNEARWLIWLCHCVGNLVNLYSFPAWPTWTNRSIFTTGKRANRTTQDTEANCHVSRFLLLSLCSFQSVFCLFIIKVRGLTPCKLLQCLQSIKGSLYLSIFKLILNLDFLCPCRSGGNRSDLGRSAAPLSSACLRTWGNWFH